MNAGFTLAKLILASDTANDGKRHAEALGILESVARHDIPEAQWLLAELVRDSQKQSPVKSHALEWTVRAADAGIVDAQMALTSHAWEKRGLRYLYPAWAADCTRHPEEPDTNGHCRTG